MKIFKRTFYLFFLDDLKIDEGDPEFVEQPTHEVTCPICASLLDDPCQSKCCGKHFCKPCITRLKKENCPLCRDPDFSVSLDKHFGRQVLSLQVMCYYNKRGCPWTGELRELKRHVDNTCNKNKFWCKYCLKEFSKTAFSLHIDVCEDTPQSCPNKCAREVKRRLLKRHLEQQCHLRVIKEGPIAHAANQSIQLVPVAFSMTKFSQYVETGDIWYSPPFYTARNGYKVHLRVEVNRYVKEHISVMLCILKSTHDNTLCWPLHAEVKVGLYDWKSRTPVYTKVLYAVGDAFCLQNATDIPASWGSGCFDFISLNTLTSHEKNVQYIRYDCLNFCIQRVTIQNIRPLPVLPTWAGNNAFVVPTLSFLKQKGISLFCGPPIYSSNQEGYKLCPQVHPCGQDAGNGSHISISCSLMKGECDDRLQWPMVADITLIMLNWREDKSHKVFTFTFSQVLDKSMVSKVTNEGMAEKSLSVPKFTAYSSLPYNPNTSTEYLKQDCLLFRVKSVVAYSDKALVSRLPVWVDQVKDSPCPCFTLTEYTRQKINNGFWYSNPFYSHHYGYKMQLKVHISNGPSVGLYVVLMMGPNDDHLQWPFCADIFLELVNWRSDSTHHSTVLRLSPKCKSNVCNRVTDSERNNGLGYEHFITHDALAYSAATGVEYLQEDCLHFRVKEIILYSTPPAIYAPSWQGRAFSPYFQFTVNSFKKRKEGDCEYLSPIFYSHQNGYKMQIEVMPNKNGFVSVFAKLLKSEYDATLSWPFTGNVKVELLNHIRDSDHHSYNIAFHERVDASISSQVQGNENSCLGKGQFISQDSLVHDQSKHTEYLKSDCLCFQVKVAAYTKTNRLPRWLNPNTPNFSFTITDISERIQMDNYYYSNPFLISKYKMCLKVSFNEYKVSEKANYVSILVCLLKGDDDNTLEWPFCGEIVIEVLNWNSSHGHVRKILALNRPELSSHERVIQETPSPEGFGISYFVPVSTLFSQYIDNGCMCVRVGDAAIYSNPFILKQPRWQQSQRATGFFTFTVTNISWRTENDRTFYSKPFYTHRNGYKMRLEIDFSHNKAPNGYLSIFARLMVGDYDSSLKWPMNVTLFLQVLNWVQNSSHIVNPIKFGGVPISGRKRVSKQDEGKRASYGIDEFSSPGELYKNSRYVQYIQDDCIRVRISTVAVLSKKWFF